MAKISRRKRKYFLFYHTKKIIGMKRISIHMQGFMNKKSEFARLSAGIV